MPPEAPLGMPLAGSELRAAAHRMRGHPSAAVLFARYHPARRQRRNHHLRRLSDAAGRALREHDAAAGSDDLLLRGVARLDRICGGLGDCRRLEAPRRLPRTLPPEPATR